MCSWTSRDGDGPSDGEARTRFGCLSMAIDVPATEPGADLLAVDAALQTLAREDPRKAQVVELRFFGGLSIEETAEALGISARTVHPTGPSRGRGSTER